MARIAKKENTLTLEEKLSQALVPETEQPYKVPKHWCWVEIGTLVTLHRGVSYNKNEAHLIKQSNDCLVLRGGNIGEGYIDLDVDNVYVNKSLVNKDQLVQAHDIIIVASTGSSTVIGKAGISLINYSDIAFGAFLIGVRPNKIVNPRFIDYYFQSDLYRNRIRMLASGININNIRSTHIMESPCPLPPLAEQQRIVERIESLFSKLDESKEKAQAVVDGFEDCKSAILHKAFTGELSEEWRTHFAKPEWSKVKLGSYLKTMETKKPSGEYFFYIDIDSIDNKRQIVREPKKTIVKNAPSRASRAVHCGDVLFSMVRPYLKNIALIDSSLQDCIASTGFYVCTPKEGLDSKFLFYLLCSKDTIDYLMQFMKGDNSPSIRKDDLLNMNILLPQLEEQKYIVELLENILNKEQKTQEIAEQIIAKIDNIKKSILAHAFRGELGTHDPTDEGAMELLKRILSTKQEKELPPPKMVRQRVVIPAKIEEKLSTEIERNIIKLFLKFGTENISFGKILSLSSHKMEIIYAITQLEKKGIIQRISNDNYNLINIE